MTLDQISQLGTLLGIWGDYLAASQRGKVKRPPRCSWDSDEDRKAVTAWLDRSRDGLQKRIQIPDVLEDERLQRWYEGQADYAEDALLWHYWELWLMRSLPERPPAMAGVKQYENALKYVRHQAAILLQHQMFQQLPPTSPPAEPQPE